MIKNLDQLNKLSGEGFEFLCHNIELKENVGRRFLINEVEIAVFRVNDEIFALNNICPHQQSHLIHDGFIEDEFVVCPAHGWKFNLRTGKKDSGSNGLDSFPVKLLDGKVYVKVHSKKFNW